MYFTLTISSFLCVEPDFYLIIFLRHKGPSLTFLGGLVINSFRFCMSLKNLYFIFARYFYYVKNSKFTVLSFSSLKKLLNCPLDCIVSNNKSVVILFFVLHGCSLVLLRFFSLSLFLSNLIT